MQSFVRQASVWAFSALFGCISLFGQGLHAFVGHSFHAHASVHAASIHEHLGDLCHSHAPCAQPTDHSDESSTVSSGGASECDHDCPICSFFSQAQITLHSVPAGCVLPVSHYVSRVAENSDTEFVGFYRSRAPPTA